MIQSLLTQYEGKYCKLLNPGNQCFDLVVAWSDMLGIPHYQSNPSPFPYVNAYQIYADFSDFQSYYFDRIPNTPEAIPQEGAILVWDKSYNGGAGHTAVALEGCNIDTIQAFSQNDPTGSKCVKKTYSYNKILGWLQPKNYPEKPQVEGKTESESRAIEDWDRLLIGLNELKIIPSRAREDNHYDTVIKAIVAWDKANVSEISTHVDSLLKERDAVEKKLQEAEKDLSEQVSTGVTLVNDCSSLEIENEELKKQMANYEETFYIRLSNKIKSVVDDVVSYLKRTK